VVFLTGSWESPGSGIRKKVATAARILKGTKSVFTGNLSGFSAVHFREEIGIFPRAVDHSKF
jgi:hypothetical protein